MPKATKAIPIPTTKGDFKQEHITRIVQISRNKIGNVKFILIGRCSLGRECLIQRRPAIDAKINKASTAVT